MWIFRKFTLKIFEQNFRENDVIINEITKELVWRKKFQWK